MDVSQYLDQAVELAERYAPRLLFVVLTLVLGLWVIRIIIRIFGRAMERGKLDASLEKFLGSLVAIFLKLLLFISVVSMLGVETTSFIAVIGAAGLAVGLALQGSLANFAGGVLILLFKPYKVGDFVEAQSVMGTVNAIQVFNTVLKTPDNKTVIVPNGAISNGIITNFSTEPTRRVDMVFGIGYSDDIGKAKDVLKRLIASDDRLLKEPAPVVVLSELGDSAVNLTVRAWCNAGDYWGIYFDMQEKVKHAFDENGINIPFPQRDVHIFNQS